MAAPLIAALRTRIDLKESLLHTAQELAHRASIYGVVRVSYSYLALKCHCSRRTIIRHIQRLIDLKLIQKSVIWIKGHFCEVNTYTFVLAWEKRAPIQGSDKTTRTLPPPREEEKYLGLGEEITNLEKGLRLYTAGSLGYVATVEKLVRLKALMAPAATG